jgi:hypothetical protein
MGETRRKGAAAIVVAFTSDRGFGAQRTLRPDHAVLQLDILPTAGLDRAAAHLAQYVRLTTLSY